MNAFRMLAIDQIAGAVNCRWDDAIVLAHRHDFIAQEAAGYRGVQGA
jgi:hypothetical protein